MTQVANFTIDYIQYLDADSQPTQDFPADITDELLRQLYRQMTLTRVLDNKTINLQRTGKMGTYAASTGQEAISVGVGYAMQKKDIYGAYYRDQGVFLQRGVKISEILAYWGGDERGSQFVNNPKDFPQCVPIASQCLHAAGAAYAMKYRSEEQAVLVALGDGATSKGDFYEAINVAGCWNLPLVFLVTNNQWAISVPRHKQTSTQTIAQKAIAGGFEGIQVDGNDIVAVMSVVKQALEKARNGGGPTLIEAITYRLSDHTTADDAGRYSKKEDLQKAWQEEPIRRLGKYLEAKGAWSKEQEATLLDECKQLVDKAVTTYLSRKPQVPTDIIDFLFETLPEPLLPQRDDIEDANS